MKSVRVLCLAAALFTVAVSSSVAEDDVNDWGKIASPSDFKPYSVLSVGTSFRLDDMDELDVAPTFHLQYLTYQSSTIGLKFSLAYNNSTKYNVDYRYFSGNPDNVAQIRHFTFEAGLRARFARGLVSPYMEGGLQLHRYWKTSSGAGETRPGINFGAGTEIRVSKKVSLDVNISHTMNDVNDRVYYAPVPNGYLDVLPSEPPFGSSFYNPTELSVSIMHVI